MFLRAFTIEIWQLKPLEYARPDRGSTCRKPPEHGTSGCVEGRNGSRGRVVAEETRRDSTNGRCGFIEAVSPSFVIFPAGHRHHHPREVTAQRYLARPGLTTDELFRTDRGDNEGGSEWSFGQTAAGDTFGDDDVDILIEPDGNLLVEYRNP